MSMRVFIASIASMILLAMPDRGASLPDLIDPCERLPRMIEQGRVAEQNIPPEVIRELLSMHAVLLQQRALSPRPAQIPTSMPAPAPIKPVADRVHPAPPGSTFCTRAALFIEAHRAAETMTSDAWLASYAPAWADRVNNAQALLIEVGVYTWDYPQSRDAMKAGAVRLALRELRDAAAQEK
jgi:hypothetical protein